MEIKSGDFFELDRSRLNTDDLLPDDYYFSKFRVLFYDQFELFVDMIMRGSEEFELSGKFRGQRIFAKIGQLELQRYGTQIGHRAIPLDWLQHIHYDLLLRISRLKTIDWDSEVFNSKTDFDSWLKENSSIEWKKETINTGKIYLKAVTKRDSWKKPELIFADNDTYFTAAELLWKASVLQDRVNTKNNGVGIYRSGSKGNIPMFYIGGFLDRANFLNKFEEIGMETGL